MGLATSPEMVTKMVDKREIIDMISEIEKEVMELYYTVDNHDRHVLLDGIIKYDIPYLKTLIRGAHETL